MIGENRAEPIAQCDEGAALRVRFVLRVVVGCRRRIDQRDVRPRGVRLALQYEHRTQLAAATAAATAAVTARRAERSRRDGKIRAQFELLLCVCRTET